MPKRLTHRPPSTTRISTRCSALLGVARLSNSALLVLDYRRSSTPLESVMPSPVSYVPSSIRACFRWACLSAFSFLAVTVARAARMVFLISFDVRHCLLSRNNVASAKLIAVFRITIKTNASWSSTYSNAPQQHATVKAEQGRVRIKCQRQACNYV